MNKKLGLAVAGALVAFSSVANAGIAIPAGDWTIDIGGNVNAFYQHTSYSGPASAASTNTINTGLLPAAIGIGGKSRQNDLDVAFQFTFFTGIDSTTNTDAGGYGHNKALGLNSLNIRQAFMTVGDASWGQIKLGRDLGVFESDAILSDMTLLGVGTPAGGGNTTLGRIGYGYVYADWKTQIQYQSPSFNGFQVTGAIDTPWQSSNSADTYTQEDMGFEGKATYDFAANDVTGRVWVGGVTQKVNLGTVGGYTATGFDLGAKASYAGAQLVASYFSGDGLGSLAQLSGGSISGTATKIKSDGYYVQGTYALPGVGTKLGLSYGESNTDAQGAAKGTSNNSWIVGAYHPLTKSVNLVAEYTYAKQEKDATAESNSKTISLGAIMFF